MKAWAVICDGGDGSASVHWFSSDDISIEDLSDLLHNNEELYQNEGSPAETLTFESKEAAMAAGILYFSDPADFQEEIF